MTSTPSDDPQEERRTLCIPLPSRENRHLTMKKSLLLSLSLLILKVSHSTLVPLEEGADVLFIGHSFFVPISRTFDELVDTAAYPKHSHREFFRGGAGGSPRSLWENNRCDIEPILATGTVEVLAMTAYEPILSADYEKWIDLALSYNSATKIFLGMPWAPDGPSFRDDVYKTTTNAIRQKSLDVVTSLRAKYPSTPIYLLHYGSVAVKMRDMLANGNLPDVDNLLGAASNSIYRDASPGHEGEMMRGVCALLMYNFLYGAAPEASLLSFDGPSVDEIISYAQGESVGLNEQTVVPGTPAPLNEIEMNSCTGGISGVSGGLTTFLRMILSFLMFWAR